MVNKCSKLPLLVYQKYDLQAFFFSPLFFVQMVIDDSDKTVCVCSFLHELLTVTTKQLLRNPDILECVTLSLVVK